jgi:hypothetical protein
MNNIGLLSVTSFTRGKGPTPANYPNPGLFFYSDALSVPMWWNGTTESLFSAVVATQALITQSVYASFGTTATTGVNSQAVETGGPWVKVYDDEGSPGAGTGATLKCANGVMYDTGIAQKVWRSTATLSATNKWVSCSASNTTATAGANSIVIGFCNATGTTLNDIPYLMGFNGSTINLYRLGVLITLTRNASAPDFPINSVRQLAVNFSLLGGVMTIRAFVDGVWVATYIDNTPLACDYPCFYSQGAGAYTDTVNTGFRDFNASDKLGNLVYSGDSIFTPDYLDTVGNQQGTIPIAIFDSFKSTFFVSGKAFSGRGLGVANNGYGGAFIKDAGDFTGKAYSIFVKNFALLEGGTNDFLQATTAINLYNSIYPFANSLKNTGTLNALGETVAYDEIWFEPVVKFVGVNETERTAYNTLLKSGANSANIKVVPIDLRTEFSDTANNIYYNTGNLHPVRAAAVAIWGSLTQQTLAPTGSATVIPSVSGQSGKVLGNDGTYLTWISSLASLLTGLSTPNNGIILATDKEIDALAKLQGQITAAKSAFSIAPPDNYFRVPVGNTLWYSTIRMPLTIAGTNVVANSNSNTGIKFQSWISDRAGVVDGLAINVSALLAAATFRIAVYRSGPDGFPLITAGPVWASASLDGATTGVKGQASGAGGAIGGALNAGGPFSVALGEVLWIAHMSSAAATLAWTGWSQFPGNFVTAAASGTALPGTAQDFRGIFRQVVFAYTATGAFPNTGVTAVAAATVTGPLNFLVRYSS